jgi:heme/copper-type cytochrome/quinol oxidase subunit 3
VVFILSRVLSFLVFFSIFFISACSVEKPQQDEYQEISKPDEKIINKPDEKEPSQENNDTKIVKNAISAGQDQIILTTSEANLQISLTQSKRFY